MNSSSEIPLRARTADGPVPPTAMQRRYWRYCTEHGDGMTVLGATALLRHIDGPLDAGLLEACIQAVATRYEALRTTFTCVGGEPVQRVTDSYTHNMERVHAAHLSAAAVDEELRKLVEEIVQRKTDMRSNDLFRSRLIRLSPVEHVFVLAIDHLITDGISNGIINNEIWQRYGMASAGSPPALPAPVLQFPDYALWQEQTRAAWMEAHSDYWYERLASVQPPELPTDTWLPRSAPIESTAFEMPLGERLSVELRKLAKRERVPLAMLVLTVEHAVLSRWTEREDLVITMTWHARHRPELESMVGWVSNDLHLRVQLDAGDRFSDLLQKVTREFSCAVEHMDFDRVPDLMPHWNIDPVCYFNWIAPRALVDTVQGALPVKLRDVELQGSTPPWIFRPFFGDTPGGIWVSIQYRRNLFSQTTVERFVSHLRAFAEVFTLNPNAKIGSLAFTR